MPPPQNIAIDWDLLVYALKNEQFILILGPEITGRQRTEGGEWQSLSQDLAMYLAKQVAPNAIHNPKNLAQVSAAFLEEHGGIKLQMQMERFYKMAASYRAEMTAAHRLIQELPPHLIINTAPDNWLERVFTQFGNAYDSEYFNYGATKGQSMVQTISKQKHFIYHLFGSVENQNSLVLTDANRLKFIETFIQGGNDNSRNAVFAELAKPNQCLVLVGFDFAQWHLHILMYLLNLNKLEQKHQGPRIVPDMKMLAQDTALFYQNLYKMQFVNRQPLAFFEELTKRYRASASEEREVPTRFNFKQSYSTLILHDANPQDDAYFTKLKQHLHPLVAKGEIAIWTRVDVGFGNETEELEEKITKAEVVIVLASADFCSKAAYQTVWEKALARWHNKEILLYHILLRACALSPLGINGKWLDYDSTIRPTPTEALPALEQSDEAIKNIVHEIGNAIVEKRRRGENE